MSEETQPLTGPQALHAAQVMERMNEDAMDTLLVLNLEMAQQMHDFAPDSMSEECLAKLHAARAALLSRLADLRIERDRLRDAALKFSMEWAAWHDSSESMPHDELISASHEIVEALGLEMVEGNDGKHTLAPKEKGSAQ